MWVMINGICVTKLCFDDWQGFAEQLFDKAGWYLPRNAETELAVSVNHFNIL